MPSNNRMKLSPATVWRWHFYAGLFCIPFVIWLACTGAMYLFKPQIDAWIDRPFDRLAWQGSPALPSAQVQAALKAVPGSMLAAYELPTSRQAATRVIVGVGTKRLRVYVHPQTLEVLKIIEDDGRFTRLLFYLHGELLLGGKGSMLVELAASWTVVMIITGLYLWWPRQRRGLGGIVYPRLRSPGRSKWKELHAVVGFWICGFTLFLLVSGLPWAKSWGGMLKSLRELGAGMAIEQDWSTGSEDEIAHRRVLVPAAQDHHGHPGHDAGAPNAGFVPDAAVLDRVVHAAAGLGVAAPTQVVPPASADAPWTVRSDAQNRTLRETVEIDGAAGQIVSRKTFSHQPLIDRMVGYGVSIHEGQFFGWLNQAIGVFTAIGLVTICVSGVVMWWRRRPAGRLGAPRGRSGYSPSAWLLVCMVALGVALPLLGLSMLGVAVLDRWVLPRLGRFALFMGFEPSGATSAQTAPSVAHPSKLR